MSFHWIDPKEYSFNSLLLMDRYLIAQICAPGCDEEYRINLGAALAANPAVAWYCQEKAPETATESKSQATLPKLPCGPAFPPAAGFHTAL